MRRRGARHPLRRAVTSCVAVGALALFVGQSGAESTDTGGATSPRPNIVVVMTDDQAVVDMIALPQVRQLIGEEGVTFENSFAVFPLCCPSRATFLTGQYAHNHGVLDNKPPLGGYTALDHAQTLPVWLQGAGYATIQIGKYLNGYEHHRTEVPPGWTEWYGAVDLSYYGGGVSVNGTVTRFPIESYQTDSYSALAQSAIERFAPQEQPFFLWITPYAVHDGGPTELDDLPGGARTPGRAERHRGRYAFEALPQPPSFNVPRRANLLPLVPEQIEVLERRYRQRLEALLAVDEMVSSLVTSLANAGELDNTVFIFTSDNGWLHGEHGLTGKKWFYDPSTRVPLLIRGPGIPRGVHLQELAANIDLAPTILDYAEVAPPFELDGRSLRPLFGDPAPIWDREFLIENRGVLTPLPYWRAIRTPQYLYAEYPLAQVAELYDAVADPHQLTNLAREPEYALVVAALSQRIAALTLCRGVDCRTPALPPIAPPIAPPIPPPTQPPIAPPIALG